MVVVGENVEPAEIEEAALRSSLIQQIVVVGQVIQSFILSMYSLLMKHYTVMQMDS